MMVKNNIQVRQEKKYKIFSKMYYLNLKCKKQNLKSILISQKLQHRYQSYFQIILLIRIFTKTNIIFTSVPYKTPEHVAESELFYNRKDLLLFNDLIILYLSLFLKDYDLNTLALFMTNYVSLTLVSYYLIKEK